MSAHALKCEGEFGSWISFQQARVFVQKRGITSTKQFRKWSKSKQRPKNFPSHPEITYKNEWTNWGDFLGTGNISNNKREWMNFEEAKVFIQNQGITTGTEFEKWSRSEKRPRNFPSRPDRTYEDKWISWNAFLGIEEKEWMSFEEAKTFIQNQGITTSTEFEKWSKSGKRPRNFPSRPDRTYKDKWTSWNEFLGTKKKEWMSFEEAKSFIQNQGITTSTEFEKWSRSEKRPKNVPRNPRGTYSEEWKGWNDFLGIEEKEWMSFEEAKAFIQTMKFTSHRQFQQWRKSKQRPRNFPSHPDKTYKNEWTNWGDFLGTGNLLNNKKEWMSFEEAKAFIQNQGITNSTEFKKWSKSGKRPKNFPSSPDRIYKGEWTSWNDFLGIKEKEWMSFEEAKAFIQNQGVTTSIEFKKWSKSGKRPKNFPSSPEKTYKNEWTNWGDFLGTGNTLIQNKIVKIHVKSKKKKQTDRGEQTGQGRLEAEKQRIYISYKEAKTFVQQFGLKNSIDFFEIKKSEPDIFPDNFPPNPKLFYSKTGEWTDWNDFLGLKDKFQENIRSSNLNPMYISDSQNNTDEDSQNAEDLLNDELNQEGDFTNDFL